MAFLVVGGTTVPVADSTPDVDTQEIGDRARAIDGTMRASITARKRVWTVKTRALTTSEASTLRTTLLSAPTMTATGDWLSGASVTVWPQVGKDTPVVASNGGFRIVMTFTLSEA
jgi:hypothetical protein